jgi:hypothetical protein
MVWTYLSVPEAYSGFFALDSANLTPDHSVFLRCPIHTQT